MNIAIGNGLQLEKVWPKELRNVKWPWVANNNQPAGRLESPQLSGAALHSSKHNLIEGKSLRDFLILMEALGGSSVEAPPTGNTVASIIIPVFNRADYTFDCLWSLLREVDLGENEIIVVNNGSADETERLLSHFKRSVHVINNRDNLGFVEACNQGAREARGRYLVFLNNDTVVRPGWLSGLVETAEADFSVGAVGSMLVCPDGRLQEAGGVVWKDATAWNYGRGEDPQDRRFNYAREVDYCSGASLLVRKSAFEESGGFDLRYAPAYYEDVDLCFRLRSLGFKVVFQPASSVLHHEGVTAGTDPRSGFKRYQEINRLKFREKWRARLEREHLDGDPRVVERAARRLGGPRIIVLDGMFTSPDNDAGSLRMTMILRSLAKWGRPELVVDPPRLSPATEQLLGRAGVRVVAFSDFKREASAGDFYAAILSRPLTARDMLPVIRRIDPQIKVVYDTVDLHFQRLEREYRLTGDEAAAAEMASMKKVETRLATLCNQVWCATTTDKEMLARASGAASIKVIPTIHQPQGRGKSFDERRDLLFIGNFNHSPNRDAVHYFVKEIYPLVRAALPGLKFHVVGSNTPDEITAYASEDIVVTGYLADVAPLFESCRVFVAPLRFGAGMKGKIGQALSFGLPTVTTSIGAEGIGLTESHDVMIADDPQRFADAVIELYSDHEVWQRLSDNGHRHVREHYSPAVIGARIVAAMKELGEPEHLFAPALSRRATSIE